MSKRTEQKLQSKELILRTAYEEFSNNGIVQTSTLQIAKACKVSHGSIFTHFPCRDDLVIAVIDIFGRRLAEAMNKSMLRCNSLLELLQSHVAVLQEYEKFYTFLVIEAPLLSNTIRNAVFYIQSGIATFLQKALQQEVDSGRVKPVNFPLLLNTWLGLLNYYLTNREKFTNNASVLKEHGEDLIAFFINNFIRH